MLKMFGSGKAWGGSLDQGFRAWCIRCPEISVIVLRGEGAVKSFRGAVIAEYARDVSLKSTSSRQRRGK